MPRKLELNRETLRQLSDESLTEVTGGALTQGPPTQTPACPSGATWLTACESYVFGICA